MFADRRLRAVRAAQASKPREPIRRGSAVFNGRELRMMIIIGLIVAVAGYLAMTSGTNVAPVESGTALAAGAHDGGTGLAPHVVAPADSGTAVAAASYRSPAPAASHRTIATGDLTSRQQVRRLLRGVLVQPAAARPLDVSVFELRGARIRIADIDAPSVTGACSYESGLAARGFRRVREWMALGPFELSEAGGRDRDAEGRRLRVVSRNGESVGSVLISEGLARPSNGQTLPWCAIGSAIL